MPLDGRLVAARDRPGEGCSAVLGPVGRGAQHERREQLAGVRDSGAPRAAPRRTPPARSGSWRRSRRRRGRRPAAPRGRRRAHPSEPGQVLGEVERGGRRSRRPRKGPGEIGRLVGDRLQRVEREDRGARARPRSLARRDSSRRWCGRRTARRGGPLRERSQAASIAASGTQSRTTSASAMATPVCSRPSSVVSMPACPGRGCDRSAHPPGADDGERGWRSLISVLVPFQFPHPRYQTESVQLC